MIVSAGQQVIGFFQTDLGRAVAVAAVSMFAFNNRPTARVSLSPSTAPKLPSWA